LSDKIDTLGNPDPNGFSAITFTISNGSVPFVTGDKLIFITTGLTAHSQPVQVVNHTVTNGPTAVINATPAAGNAPLLVNFNSVGSTDPAGLPLTFTWNFGDGQMGNGPTVMHTYQLPGTYIATLTATNTAGQFGQSSIQILAINDLPVAHIVASPRNGPLPLTVMFSGQTSSDPEGQPLIYQWNFGDCPAPGCLAGNGMPGAPFDALSHTYTQAGLYTAALTVIDPAGGMGQDTVQIVAGNTAPVVVVAVDNGFGAAPLDVTFHDAGSFDPDNPSAGATGLTFTWNFGDSSPTEQGASVTHTYMNPGPYNPTVTVTDSPSNPALALSTTQNIQQIFVTAPGNPPPNPGGLVPAFTTDHTSGTAPLPVIFDASGSSGPAGTPLTYSWNFGDGGTGAGIMVSHTFQTAGTYMARLTLTAGSNSASVTHTIIVTPSGTPPPTPQTPVARISATPLTGAVPLTVAFDAGSSTPADGTLTFSWDFGDSATATGVQVQHTYNATGAYTATLRAVNSAGSSMATVAITVTGVTGNRAPVARIATAPTSGLAGARLTFDGNLSSDPDGDTLTYLWEVRLGDQVVQTIDTGARVSILFDQAGEYTVTLTVTDANGASATSDPVAVSIRARSEPPPVSPSNGNSTRRPVRNPSVCGIGLISVLGTALGLMALSGIMRRRR
jgi:PKD repeat protein